MLKSIAQLPLLKKLLPLMSQGASLVVIQQKVSTKTLAKPWRNSLEATNKRPPSERA